MLAAELRSGYLYSLDSEMTSLLNAGLTLLILGLTLAGHGGIWVAMYNQMNASNLPLVLKKVFSKILLGGMFALATLFVAIWYPVGPLKSLDIDPVKASPLGGYAIVCWLFAAFVTARWLLWKVTLRKPANFQSKDGDSIDLVDSIGHPPVGDALTRFFAKWPGNEIFQLEVTRKEFRLSELPSRMDNLTIAHLSDLHMTGRIDREFYEEIVKETNRLAPDLIVITGDIIDKRKCLGWLEPVLSKLKAKYGVYYVLGNHDLRVRDEKGLRKRLKQAGLIEVNGRWVPVRLNGGTLWIAGNELPWFKGAEKLASEPEGYNGETDMRLILSHSPDQVEWARKKNFGLLLAGHTHGGQIRFPVIGPTVSPSRYGVKYASGEFQVGPVTMHVSRGLCGVHPVRFHCPPELALLTLRAETNKQGEKQAERSQQLRAADVDEESKAEAALESLPRELAELSESSHQSTDKVIDNKVIGDRASDEDAQATGKRR